MKEPVATKELPKFNSLVLAKQMRVAPLITLEAGREILEKLRPLSESLNDACAAHSTNVPLLMALGYVICAIVELDMCIVAAYPELEERNAGPLLP